MSEDVKEKKRPIPDPYAPDSPEGRLCDALRKWRRAQAIAGVVPPYIVFPNQTLYALVAQRPATAEGLAQVPGFGPNRQERYGEAVLRVLREEAAVQGLTLGS